MMRIFLTRLVNSVTRATPLIPCLLVCISCATPFPFDKLEEGLTVETVLTEFGPPEAIESGSGDAGPSWCYAHEEQDWLKTFFPLTPVSIPILAVDPGSRWSDAYFRRSEVALHFEEGRLVRWDKRLTTRYWNPRQDGIPLRYCWSGDPNHCIDNYNYGELDFFEKSLYSSVPEKAPGTGEWAYPSGPPACEWERATAEGVVKIGDYLYVARDYVSFWMEPTASSENKVSVARGQRMTLLGKRRGWCHLEDEFGTTGWITCVFLNAEAPQTSIAD